jgi:hypothetical protein
MQRIIPCHFDAPIQAEPHQFRQAFAFLEQTPASGESISTLLPEQDFELLKAIDTNLYRVGIVPPPKEKVSR